MATPELPRRGRDPAQASAAPGGNWAQFRIEFDDFLAFVRRPALGPRLPRSSAGSLGPRPAYLSQEWMGGLSASRLMCWVLLLWAINLTVLGPLAATVAGASGAEHRLPKLNLSWFHVVLWAPVVEELLFRFGLRRPAWALWLSPILIAALLAGPSPVAAVSAGLALCGVLCLLSRQAYRWPWARLRRYDEIFPFVFHIATLAFAFLHLSNFRLADSGLWLLPLLVLPQWVTGLVLGWMRVRFGILSSIALHSLFNAGPMALLWWLLHYAPGALEG